MNGWGGMKRSTLLGVFTWIRRNDWRKSASVRARNSRRAKRERRGESLHRAVVHSPVFMFSFCVYLLTSWSRVLLEKLTSSQLIQPPPTKELAEGGDLREIAIQRPSVRLAIPEFTASLGSVTDTLNWDCAYTNWFPVAVDESDVGKPVLSWSRNSPHFMEPRRFITAFTSARHLSLSWARSIQPMPS